MQAGKRPDGDQCVVETVKLTKVFRDFWRRPKIRAVDALDIEIHSGEVFGLLGPNGSGKSTTLKILLGLLYPTSGRARVLGSSPRSVPAKRHIGYLPEDSYLYSTLTARETLDFYGRLFDLDSRLRRRRIEQLLDMVNLTDDADRAVGEFSKGMGRRLGLAQALINDPKLVILDEPTAGLDPIGCRQVKDLIVTLSRRGKTVLLSSHLLADVEDVCDRVAVLYSGRLRAMGRVRELLEKPDRLRLTIPCLPADEMKRVLALVREKVGTEPEVDHPAMALEQFFLQVVDQAHGAGPGSPHGPRGRGLAGYLADNG